jgi:hypothetical protein
VTNKRKAKTFLYHFKTGGCSYVWPGVLCNHNKQCNFAVFILLQLYQMYLTQGASFHLISYDGRQVIPQSIVVTNLCLIVSYFSLSYFHNQFFLDFNNFLVYLLGGWHSTGTAGPLDGSSSATHPYGGCCHQTHTSCPGINGSVSYPVTS